MNKKIKKLQKFLYLVNFKSTFIVTFFQGTNFKDEDLDCVV